MGALTTVYLLPNLLLSLHAGVWVDRSGRRREVMLAADVVRGLLTATIPIAFAFGDLTWPQLYVVSFLLGCASVFFFVGYGGFFQTVVAREDFIEANALLNGSRGFSVPRRNEPWRCPRPAPPRPVRARTRCGVVLLVGAVPQAHRRPGSPGAARESGGIGTGLRWIRGNPVIRAELLGVATINLFNFVFCALFLLYASRYLHVAPATIGVVHRCGGRRDTGRVGALRPHRPGDRARARPFSSAASSSPPRCCSCRRARGPHWLVITFLFTAEFISGVGLMLLDILAGVIQGALIPPPVRSRVSGAFMVVNYGVRPLGTSIAGVLGSTIGVHNTIWIGAGGALLGMAFLLPSPIRRLKDVPEPADV